MSSVSAVSSAVVASSDDTSARVLKGVRRDQNINIYNINEGRIQTVSISE